MRNNKQTKSTPTRHIVTGFDANYLHKALAYYESLLKVHRNFQLYIFCFDEVTYQILDKLKLNHVILYHTSDFETKELLNVKKSKQRLYEYYWACNPAMVKKVISDKEVDYIALSDSDLMFFQSPEIIYKEMEGADIIIQPNNFSLQQVKDFLPVGYYCTSFQIFKNNQKSKKIIDTWYEQCIKWCSSKFEKDKFGDQKYLEDWKVNYQGVREIINPGTNVAPWNIHKFDLKEINHQIYLNNIYPLVYYHFHSFKINLNKKEYSITGDRNNTYEIPTSAINTIYKPYIKLIKDVLNKLHTIPIYKNYTKQNPKGNYHKNIL